MKLLPHGIKTNNNKKTPRRAILSLSSSANAKGHPPHKTGD
jgi:hypothetical protein